MVESRTWWIEKDKENQAVVLRAVQQGGSIPGLAVCTCTRAVCHGDSLCCLDRSKCKTAEAWAVALLILASLSCSFTTRLRTVGGMCEKGSDVCTRCGLWANELQLWFPALKLTFESTTTKTRCKPSRVGIPGQLLPLWPIIAMSLQAWGGCGVPSPSRALDLMQNPSFFRATMSTDFQRWTGLCNGAFSAIGSSSDVVVSCRDIQLLGELHPGKRPGCLCPSGFFVVVVQRNPARLLQHVPAHPQHICLLGYHVRNWGAWDALSSCNVPTAALRQTGMLFFHAESHQFAIHDRNQSRNILV